MKSLASAPAGEIVAPVFHSYFVSFDLGPGHAVQRLVREALGDQDAIEQARENIAGSQPELEPLLDSAYVLEVGHA